MAMEKVHNSVPSMSARMKSFLLFRREPPPIFNKPIDMNICPHHQTIRILYGVLLALLLSVATPIVVLRAMTTSFIEDFRMQGFVFETTEPDGGPGVQLIMAALPRRLYYVPAKISLVAAVVSILLCFAHLGFITSDWKTGKRTQSYAFSRNIMFLHITNALLILFALVSVFVTHKNVSHFRDGYVESRANFINDKSNNENYFRYNIGRFDLETWACDLKDVKGAAMVQDDYRRQCGIEMAARNLMIPFIILAVGLAGVGVWGLLSGGRRGPDGERMRTEDVGLEMDKLRAES